ncbi:hypothetical protein GCM10025768_03500 [Microbacterium pseudoresistens]|uniref:Uncharacterized protein n=1 Tax=Microbacterium pseudoresistens TaxID=640634 RepID=A0A7Y9JMM4_9MICO|nr:hypothetical protein [Microbacterium pseudoresistens]NYD54186.1 hypothetical protein [Microbacterium pseudoresistens]
MRNDGGESGAGAGSADAAASTAAESAPAESAAPVPGLPANDIAEAVVPDIDIPEPDIPEPVIPEPEVSAQKVEAFEVPPPEIDVEAAAEGASSPLPRMRSDRPRRDPFVPVVRDPGIPASAVTTYVDTTAADDAVQARRSAVLTGILVVAGLVLLGAAVVALVVLTPVVFSRLA